MNRRQLIHLLAACALFTGSSDARNAPGIHVGQTLRYDSGLKLTFLAVRNDSRCPINARCIWAGDAEVVLRVKAGNQEARKIVLHTNLKPRKVTVPAEIFPPGTAGIPKSYVIALASLSPQPEAGKKLLQSDYELQLNISVAQ